MKTSPKLPPGTAELSWMASRVAAVGSSDSRRGLNGFLALSSDAAAGGAPETAVLIPGVHNGHPLDEAALREMVETYNPEAQPAPIKLTHAERQTAAYGWVKGLRVGSFTPPGQTVPRVALFAQLEPTEAGRKAVQSGGYRMKSLEAWPKNHPSNPTPGRWNFRALALLGGDSPACPNLGPLTLAAEDAVTETPVLVLQADDTPNHGGSEPPQKGDPMDPKELAALQARAVQDAAANVTLQAQVAELTAKLDATQKAQEKAVVQAGLDGLVKENKLTPAQANLALPILLSVPASGVVALAEGKTATPREALLQLLGGLNGHGLTTPSGVPHTTPVALSSDSPDSKAFDQAVQKHLATGKTYPEAMELAARDLA